MFRFTKTRDRARAWIKQEIARYAKANMVPYTATRQCMDIYEMRLETIDTRLGKRLRELEARVDRLEAELAAERERGSPGVERWRSAG